MSSPCASALQMFVYSNVSLTRLVLLRADMSSLVQLCSWCQSSVHKGVREVLRVQREGERVDINPGSGGSGGDVAWAAK